MRSTLVLLGLLICDSRPNNNRGSRVESHSGSTRHKPAGRLTAGAAGSETAVQEIRAVLARQQAAWNRGDVRAFLDDYLRDESTVFVSGGKVTRGHAQVLENYLRRYPTRDRMGSLTFSTIEVTPLCADAASVLGRWKLARPAGSGGDVGGVFTLVFRKTASGWKIVADHTS